MAAGFFGPLSECQKHLDGVQDTVPGIQAFYAISEHNMICLKYKDIISYKYRKRQSQSTCLP